MNSDHFSRDNYFFTHKRHDNVSAVVFFPRILDYTNRHINLACVEIKSLLSLHAGVKVLSVCLFFCIFRIQCKNSLPFSLFVLWPILCCHRFFLSWVCFWLPKSFYFVVFFSRIIISSEHGVSIVCFLLINFSFWP